MPKQPAGGPKHVLGLDDDAIKLMSSTGGSVPIDEEELSAAFDFFDVDKTGKLNAAGVKTRLSAFYRNLPSKEIKLLLGEGTFTKDTLRGLLENNDLGAYDPIREAFKAFDPNNTGYADTDTLRHIFESLGFGDIDDDDLNVLIETADTDGDGKISLDDFRRMMSHSRGAAKAAPAAAPPPAPADSAAAADGGGAAASS